MKRALTLILSIVYFGANVVFVHAQESEFWRERRQTNTQIASLPTLPTPLNSNGLAEPADLFRKISALDKSIGSSITKNTHRVPRSLPANLRAMVDKIPARAAAVKDINVGAPDKGLVVIVQDVHMNTEAQRNIVEVLEALKQPLAVEGANGPFDFHEFAEFSNKQAVRAVADDFLSQNRFSAVSHFGMTSSALVDGIVGVDDDLHYEANVAAVRESAKLKKQAVVAFERVVRELSDKKTKNLNKELLALDARRAAYQEGSMGFGDYVTYLAQQPTGAEGIELAVEQFVAAYAMEKKMDFARVESERARVIEHLSKKLAEKELTELVSLSLVYKAGNVSYADYYRQVRRFAERAGIKLNDFPAFDEYIRYVMLSDVIDAERLFSAVLRMEQNIIRGLCRNRLEADLMTQSRRLYLTRKLLDFSLTPEEWEEYRGVRSAESAVRHNLLEPFDEFYTQADIRSHAMVDNLRTSHSGPSTVLVVGGFHTPVVTSELKRRGTSFIVVQPKITKIEGTGTEYLSIFTREKSTLDKLFAGEKLFLAPRELLMGRPMNGVDRTKISARKSMYLNAGLPFNELAALAKAAANAVGKRARRWFKGTTESEPETPQTTDSQAEEDQKRNNIDVRSALSIEDRGIGSDISALRDTFSEQHTTESILILLDDLENLVHDSRLQTKDAENILAFLFGLRDHEKTLVNIDLWLRCAKLVEHLLVGRLIESDIDLAGNKAPRYSPGGRWVVLKESTGFKIIPRWKGDKEHDIAVVTENEQEFSFNADGSRFILFEIREGHRYYSLYDTNSWEVVRHGIGERGRFSQDGKYAVTFSEFQGAYLPSIFSAYDGQSIRESLTSILLNHGNLILDESKHNWLFSSFRGDGFEMQAVFPDSSEEVQRWFIQGEHVPVDQNLTLHSPSFGFTRTGKWILCSSGNEFRFSSGNGTDDYQIRDAQDGNLVSN